MIQKIPVPKPILIRVSYAALTILMIMATWLGYAYINQEIKGTQLKDLQRHTDLELLLFEDHLAKTLDAIDSTLNAAEILSSSVKLDSLPHKSQSISSLIELQPAIRSLSLSTKTGKVIASSDLKNIGAQIPPQVLSSLIKTSSQINNHFGEVYGYRDLYLIGKGRNDPEISFWLIGRELSINGQQYFWLATINLPMFLNFWERVEHDTETSIALVDFFGRTVLISGHQGKLSQVVVNQLNNYLDQSSIGRIDINSPENLRVAYRSNLRHPVTLLAINDLNIFFDKSTASERKRFNIALAISVLTAIILGLLYRNHIQHESLITEISNQHRAIGEHLMMIEINKSGDILSANNYLLNTLGYTLDQLIGKSFNTFNEDIYPSPVNKEIKLAIRHGNTWQGVFRKSKVNGETFWANSTIIPFKNVWGKVTKYVAFLTDVTQAVNVQEKYEKEQDLRHELAEINRELAQNANTDVLTECFNRRAFDVFFKEAIDKSKNNQRPVSILILDLDLFKHINDTYGHLIGDQILKESVKRWKKCIRVSDMLARIGGEEFCIVLPETGLDDAKRVAQKILSVTSKDLFEAYLDNSSQKLRVTVSIGVSSVVPTNTTNVDQLMSIADNNLYEAKRNGRNQYKASQVG